MGMNALLRKDLSVKEIRKQEGTVYQVVDPLNGEAFEFGDKEWFLLSRLDSSSGPVDIIEEFKRKYQTEIAPDHIESLIAMAKEWGLCSDPDEQDSVGADIITISPGYENIDGHLQSSIKLNDQPFREAPRKVRSEKQGARRSARSSQRTARIIEENFRDPELTWTFFNPGDVFLALSQFLSPLRYAVYLLPLMVLIGVSVVFNNLPELIHDHREFRVPLTVLQLLLYSLFTVNLITQLANGIVRRGLGMDVNGFGIRMIFGIIPRFGIHSSGISRLEKKQQLHVHLAPLFIRLTLFSGSSVLWMMSRNNGTHVASVYLMVATVSVVSFILSANPLFNSSGYKYLATLLDMPNLRRRAFRTLFLKRNEGDSIPQTDQDSFALRTYALVTVAFYVLMFGALGVAGARWLESHFRGTGVIIFLLLSVYFVIRLISRRKRRRKQRRVTMRRPLEEMPGFRARGRFQQRLREPVEPDALEDPEDIKPAKSKRPWLKYVVALIFLVVAFLPYPYETGGDSSIIPIEQVWIYGGVGGIITKVFHDGNEHLAAGTLIATLSSVEQEKEIQTTAAAILKQKAQLELLLTTPTKEDLDLAQTKLDTAQVHLKYSTDTTERLRQLYKAGNISYEEYLEEERKRDVDRADVAEAKAYLAKVKAGPNPEEIEAARSELKRLEEEQRFQQMELDMTRLVMPFDGYLVTTNLKDKQGKYLNKGDMFAVAERSDSVRVDIKIPETDISDVRHGASVRLKIWTYPEHIFHGKVSEIDRAVSKGTFGDVVLVSATIPNSDGLLQTGMTGFGKVDGGEKFVVVAFSRMLVRFFLVELWSWIP